RRRYSRTILGAGGKREEPRGGDIVEVVTGLAAARPILAIARDGAIDRARIYGFDGFVVEAEPRHHARAELLDHYVAACQKGREPRPVVGRLKVEHDAFLAAIKQR